MKSISNLLIIFTAIVMNGCNQEYNAITLEGTWQVTDMDAIMPEISPAIIEEGERLALSTTYFFRSDNTCRVTSSYHPDGFEGIWNFSQDSMLLKVQSTDEIIVDNSNYTIEFVNKKKIHLSEQFDQLGSLKMTLKKRKP